MIGLALSGGGSRAMAFHLGCLRALNDLGVLDKVNVVSTISGGSVIGAYYTYTPEKSFDEFDKDIVSFLKTGFQRSIAIEIAKPKNIIPCLYYFTLSRLQKIFLPASEHQKFRRLFSRTDMFKTVLKKSLFSDMTMSSPRRNNIDVVVGACELRTGSAFRFGNQKSGGWRFGQIVNEDSEIAFAVTASAAYPIFLPALDRVWTFNKNNHEKTSRVLLTDGGIYDNLGIQVLEPGRNPDFSLHTYPCEYMIVCNAGHGQETGDALPLTFYHRVNKSFEIVHRRVQDSSMQRLHQLKLAGLIKGFVMPYLGQQDSRLPVKPNPLVPREDVLGYPTDFASMNEEWIEKLSSRGEQLTRSLVSYYLFDLL